MAQPRERPLADPPGMARSAPIGQQPLGSRAGPPGLAGAPHRDGGERLFEARDFCWGSRLQGRLPAEVPGPSTRTLPFVPVPRLVLPTVAPPGSLA